MATSVVMLNVADWLKLTNRGRAYNFSLTVAAGATVNQATTPCLPLEGDAMIYVDSIQFDGVSSGQVGYQVVCPPHSIVAFAVQGAPVPIDLVSYGPLAYSIENSQTGPAVVNFQLISLSSAFLQENLAAVLARL